MMRIAAVLSLGSILSTFGCIDDSAAPNSEPRVIVQAATTPESDVSDAFRTGRHLPVVPEPQRAGRTTPSHRASIQEEVASATIVGTAKCLNKVSYFKAGETLPESIVTDYYFEPIESLRGETPRRITLPGGDVGTVSYMVSHVARFKPGAKYLLASFIYNEVPVVVAAATLNDDDVVALPGGNRSLQEVRDIVRSGAAQ